MRKEYNNRQKHIVMLAYVVLKCGTRNIQKGRQGESMQAKVIFQTYLASYADQEQSLYK